MVSSLFIILFCHCVSGYLYAGVQDMNLCYCGNHYGSYSLKKPDDECNKACSGNASQICGDYLRNSVYQTVNPGNYVFYYSLVYGSSWCMFSKIKITVELK